MRVAIHQPNFMPWYPFFQKISRADVFIILTNAQFVKGNYHNRFNINGRWYTMGVNKEPAFQTLEQKIYSSYKSDWEKIKRRLPEHAGLLSLFDFCIDQSLVITNTLIIQQVCTLLKIGTKLYRSRETHKTGADNLLQLCQDVNASVYVAGPSTVRYFKEEDFKKFEDAGIEIEIITEEEQNRKPILEVLHEVLP